VYEDIVLVSIHVLLSWCLVADIVLSSRLVPIHCQFGAQLRILVSLVGWHLHLSKSMLS
jgi:hypothetical protein